MDKNEERQDKSLIDKLREKTKKANRSNFKLVASRIFKFVLLGLAPLIKGLVLIAIIAVIVTALTHILDLEGTNSIVGVASAAVIKDHVNIQEAENSEDGYYFKIDKEVIDEYVKALDKAYKDGYYFVDSEDDDEDDGEGASNDQNDDEEDEENSEQEEFIYDEEDADITKNDIADWFLTDNYEPYLIKMIKAQVATSYPRLGNYTGEDGTEDNVGNKQDKDRKLCGSGYSSNKENKNK